MNAIVYHNGKWEKSADASMGLYSQSLHYGNGVFEGIRSYQTREGTVIFKAKEHFDRLHFSAAAMGIELMLSSDELTNIAYQLLNVNHLSNAYIRPLVYTGIDMGLGACKEAYLFMAAWEWTNYMDDKMQHVMLSSFERPNPKSCIVEAKVCGHYTNSILATAEARREGYDSALLMDMYGNVAEGPGANFFAEKDGVLYTPPVGNILPGITRDTIMTLAKELGFEVREERFGPQFLETLDAAFFTGTAAEVKGIGSIGNRTLPLAWEDTMGYSLMLMYKQLVINKKYSEITMV